MKPENKRIYQRAVLIAVIILPYLGMFLQKRYFDKSSVIVVDKQRMELRVVDYKGRELLKCPAATGKNYGNKKVKGDFKTPEGIFHIKDIRELAVREYDLGSGRRYFGPYFFGLDTPGHKGIGIHGTDRTDLLGSRDSEGCIRIEDQYLERVKHFVRPGTMVIVIPGEGDIYADLNVSGKLDSLDKVVSAAAEKIKK